MASVSPYQILTSRSWTDSEKMLFGCQCSVMKLSPTSSSVKLKGRWREWPQAELGDLGLKGLPRVAVHCLAAGVQIERLLREIAIGLHAANSRPQNEMAGVKRRMASVKRTV